MLLRLILVFCTSEYSGLSPYSEPAAPQMKCYGEDKVSRVITKM